MADDSKNGIFGHLRRFALSLRPIQIVIGTAGAIAALAFTYVQFKQFCGPTPWLQCVMGASEQEAQAAWEQRVAHTLSKAEIESFIKRYGHSSLAAAAKVRLAAVEEWDSIAETTSAAQIRRFLERHPDPALSKATRLRLTQLDRRAWRQAIETGSRLAIELYLSEWPDGESVTDARSRLLAIADEEAAARARREATIEAVELYLRSHPGGRHAAEMRARLAELKEDAAWAAVAAGATPELLRSYLKEYHRGKYVRRAHELLEQLDDQAWARFTRAPSLAAVQRYLEDWPNGRHSIEAYVELGNFDDKAWAQAHAEGTPSAIRAYIARFARGKHVGDARRFLSELEDDQEWRQATATNTAEGYRRYLAAFAEGRHKAEARKQLEELAAPEDCDRLAGNPDDPGRRGSGTPYVMLIPEPAIAACEKAAQMQPDTARLMYQLARAYQKAQRWDQARRLLEQLIAIPYVAAFDNLGWLYANGQGVAKAPAVAERYFLQAANRGLGEAMFSLFLLLKDKRADEADKWLRRAAQAGYGQAIERLSGNSGEIASPASPKTLKQGMEDFKEGIEQFKGMIELFKKPR